MWNRDHQAGIESGGLAVKRARHSIAPWESDYTDILNSYMRSEARPRDWGGEGGGSQRKLGGNPPRDAKTPRVNEGWRRVHAPRGSP